MSEENVELARRSIDALNRRDLDAYLALMDDDIEAISRLVAIEGAFEGHDGIRRWWQALFDIWPDFRVEVVAFDSVAGDVTLGTVRLQGRGAGSDIPWHWSVCAVGRWRRGKCVWWGNYETRAEALEAVGVS